ncbi:MAG: hypothetical protein ACOX4M_07055 [Acetivibrionales bacterium]
MSNRKILPAKYPMITTYTQHAHLLSILSNYENTYDWIYSNYIQLYINRDYKHNWGDFYFPLPYEIRPSDSCKWILTQKINRDLAETKWESFVHFVIDRINAGQYVHTMLNYYFVPFSIRYMRMNLHHDILIYGYDMSKEILFVSDFFNFGIYSYEELSFSDCLKAYNTYNLTTNPDYLNKMIYLYTFNESCDYKFDIMNILNFIKAYINGTTPEYWELYNEYNKPDIVFGIQVYESLSNYIGNVTSYDPHEIDIRPFHLLSDHKTMMCLRFRYLSEKGYYNVSDSLLADLYEIEARMKKLINIVLKCRISRDKSYKDKIQKELADIANKEFNILKNIT